MKLPREAKTWSGDTLKKAYERYAVFYAWANANWGEGRVFHEIVESYTKDPDLQEELIVMFGVSELANKNRFGLKDILEVVVNEKGEYQVKVDPWRKV